jgi:hypothetical protein
VTSPCCGAQMTPRQYSYEDHETGYKDRGTEWRCPKCHEVYDEEELDAIFAPKGKT